MEATNPEHTYKFFPSQDTWTWEQEATGNDVSLAHSNTLQEQAQFEEVDRATHTRGGNPTGGPTWHTGERVAQSITVENQIRDEGWTRVSTDRVADILVRGTRHNGPRETNAQQHDIPPWRTGGDNAWPPAADGHP